MFCCLIYNNFRAIISVNCIRLSHFIEHHVLLFFIVVNAHWTYYFLHLFMKFLLRYLLLFFHLFDIVLFLWRLFFHIYFFLIFSYKFIHFIYLIFNELLIFFFHSLNFLITTRRVLFSVFTLFHWRQWILKSLFAPIKLEIILLVYFLQRFQ
jgi:hypothetical protein